MKPDDARLAVVGNLLAKVDQALAAAIRNFDAGDAGLATNRVYYACFYAVSAVLLNEQRKFGKHSSVRAALHEHLIRPGRLSTELGKFYDRAFAERQEADYNAMATFDEAMVRQRIGEAQQFVAAMKNLIQPPPTLSKNSPSVG